MIEPISLPKNIKALFDAAGMEVLTAEERLGDAIPSTKIVVNRRIPGLGVHPITLRVTEDMERTVLEFILNSKELDSGIEFEIPEWRNPKMPSVGELAKRGDLMLEGESNV